MSKPEVGQTIFVTANRHERNINGLVSFTVTKVGRLYYHVGHENKRTGGFYEEARFRLEDNLEELNVGTPRRAFFSEQAYFDEQECLRRFMRLQKCFERKNDKVFSLDQLREVCRVLGLEESDGDSGCS